MARNKVVNRKELRQEAEAAEQMEAEQQKAKPQKAEPKKAEPKASQRSSRSKPTKEVRLKAYWGVFSQSLQAVALFEYSQRAEAKEKAEQLTQSKKSPHFVQLVKKVIEE